MALTRRSFVQTVGIGAGAALTGGVWGLVIRRVLEAATRTLPLILILFIPIIVGLKLIYPWTSSELMNSVESLKEKASYLSPGFFIIRAAIYFAFWSVCAWALNWFSLQQDLTARKRYRRRMQMVSGPGLAFLIISITFASVDWVMSLEPAWFSTIFGLIFVAAWSLAAARQRPGRTPSAWLRRCVSSRAARRRERAARWCHRCHRPSR